MALFTDTIVNGRLVQIGWLAEDIPNEEALRQFIADATDSEFVNIEPMSSEITDSSRVYHSHRQSSARAMDFPSRYLRVYVAWETTDADEWTLSESQ